MCSARKLLAICLLASAIAGCQRAESSPKQVLSKAPIIEDEAMALRQWEPSTAVYSNGASIAYPTLYPYVARRNVPGIEPLILNPVIFFAQTAMLPITFFTTPAWESEINRGVTTEPTYTAVPQVAPDAQSWVTPTGWEILPPRR